MYWLHFQKVPVLIDEIEEKTIRDEKIVSELKLEMFDGSPSTISWNIDKVARRDKKLRPVFIPFWTDQDIISFSLHSEIGHPASMETKSENILFEIYCLFIQRLGLLYKKMFIE